jgi:hypothetical protein
MSFFHCLGRAKESVQVRGVLKHFYGEGLSAPRPTPKLEDHNLSAVHDCLFNLFAATLRIWRPSLHPQPEDAPCRGDKGPPIYFGFHKNWDFLGKMYNSALQGTHCTMGLILHILIRDVYFKSSCVYHLFINW